MAPRPDAPKFETLDGCPWSKKMIVKSRKPTVRLSIAAPIDAFDWQLWQAGERIDEGEKVTTGITDGCIEFTPTVKLRRGTPQEWELEDGFFYPPFRARKTFTTETYRGHTNFSVDFNRSNDRGELVRAPARGTVAYRKFRAPKPGDDGESDLLIQHAGNIATLYTHMNAIPKRLKVGAVVELGDRLGRISDVGEATGPHLHHGHYSRQPGAEDFGTPIRMKIKGETMEASVGNSKSGRPADWPGVFGQNVRGVPYRPFFKVRVFQASAPGKRWSHWRRRGFFVSLKPSDVADCVDPGCGPG